MLASCGGTNAGQMLQTENAAPGHVDLQQCGHVSASVVTLVCP